MTNRKLYTGFPTSHQPRFYAAPNFLKMGIKYLNCRLLYNFDNKAQEVCLKVSLYKNCQRQSCSAVDCLSSGINILAGGSSVPLILSPCKGTYPSLDARAFHTLRLIARRRPLASLACFWLIGWLVISTVWSIVCPLSKTFTQFDCQSNSSTNCRINSWTDCSSNCQIHTQTV